MVLVYVINPYVLTMTYILTGIYSSTIEPEGDSTLQRALVTIAIHEQSNLMEEAIADHFPAVKKHGKYNN